MLRGKIFPFTSLKKKKVCEMFLLLFLFFVLLTPANSVNATDVFLSLGQSACHVWPCDNIGKGYYGMMTAFLEAIEKTSDTPHMNVDLISWNDSYNYTLATQNTVAFFGQLSVFGMIGVSGSQSADDSATVALSNGWDVSCSSHRCTVDACFHLSCYDQHPCFLL